MKHNGVWILAEQNGGIVQRISHELITRGRKLADKLGCDLTAMILGSQIGNDGLQGLLDRGADRVIAMQAPQLEFFLIEPYAKCMMKLLEDYRPEILIAGATTTGRTLLPYVAVKVHTGLTADCTVLDIEDETGNLLQTRPAIGGNILATIKTPNHRPQMATVRPRSTQPATVIEQNRAGEIIRLDAPPELLTSKIKRTGFTPLEDSHNIEDADVVVAVGRGIKKADNLPVVQKLADSLDAALGASRDVIDRGWMSYPHQIGLSGKTVTPKLYVGVGVSGAIQHLAGMQTAENIVVINNDPDAQLFRVADIGIVGDLFEIVPVLTQKINERKKP
ncbi:MAG: electron transfer flavoprotein subunit alpha/FixB family protein [Phycisphaerae bacterium]|nr:electron transfer flavoprotein subunit alpha/FixB family protein [Phycisphaerae bacterium]